MVTANAAAAVWPSPIGCPDGGVDGGIDGLGVLAVGEGVGQNENMNTRGRITWTGDGKQSDAAAIPGLALLDGHGVHAHAPRRRAGVLMEVPGWLESLTQYLPASWASRRTSTRLRSTRRMRARGSSACER